MDNLPQSPEQAVQFVWWTSLVLGVIVSGVVGLLLWQIYRAAAKINGLVSGIWDAGQRAANNTVHIPALIKTNEVAGRILATAVRIDAAAAAIERHANGCPGCPQCLREHRPR